MRKIKIDRKLIKMRNDLVITVQNENGHIGSVVTAYPYEKNGEIKVTLSMLNTLGHKDDEVAKRYAGTLAKFYNCTVTCICGIHLDDIAKDEIGNIMEQITQDIQKMLE